MQTLSPEKKPVRRRRVLYIPGYDPFHPRRYRELYRKEGALQSEISGYELKVSPARTKGPFGWHVHAKIDGASVETDFEVLVWSDIVKASMEQSILATYWQLIQTAWTYMSTGALFRLMKLRKGPVIAALYPIFFLLTQLLVAVMLARIVFGGLSAFGLGLPLSLLAALLALLGSLEVFRRNDNKFFAYYLMHDYAFSARWGGANPPELDARLSQFRMQIEAALNSEADEVLVVGHSSGAHLAVSVLAELLQCEAYTNNAQKLAFLSLGQVIPMMTFLPDAKSLRRDLNVISRCATLPWVDVTAPGDGCSFALCDPVSVSGVADARSIWPLVLSAAFTRTLSPERWRALRWRFFRLHFQYLCAFDRPADYDYFQITAGPVRLGARFSGRASSPSRITTSVNRVFKTSEGGL